MYKKHLKDNVVKVIVEYSLSFIMGTLYAYILTYAFTSALILFLKKCRRWIYETLVT